MMRDAAHFATIHRLPTAPTQRRRAGRPLAAQPAAPPISNSRIAIAMVLVAETMFFAGLIGAYLVFRVASPAWPPPNLPRLPLGITWVNTLILMASGLTMLGALRAVRANEQQKLIRGLGLSGLLGTLFLLVQGSEWVRLVHYGLTLSAGPYGATFYTLVGMHAAHVLGAVLWLAAVWVLARRGHYRADHYAGVEVCAVYWFFVCALWLGLFALVY